MGINLPSKLAGSLLASRVLRFSFSNSKAARPVSDEARQAELYYSTVCLGLVESFNKISRAMFLNANLLKKIVSTGVAMDSSFGFEISRCALVLQQQQQ